MPSQEICVTRNMCGRGYCVEGILCRGSPVPVGKHAGTKYLKSYVRLCVDFCRFPSAEGQERGKRGSGETSY
jgi:hypothetical protein